MSFSLNCRGVLRSFNKPIVMGIVNLNNNSFYSESRASLRSFIDLVDKHLSEGVDIIDLGATSSQPGSSISDPDTELQVLLPAIKKIRTKNKQIIISIDTYHSVVADACMNAGADMINDISAGEIDPLMPDIIKKWSCPYIIMHMQGKPENMQNAPLYSDVVTEVYAFLHQKVDGLRLKGISDIIIDPGFGFGKTIEDNFKLLKDLNYFHHLNLPILVGLSRKSMIYKTLGIDPQQSLNGTSFCHTIALENQAQILRVHDVKEAKQLINLKELLHA